VRELCICAHAETLAHVRDGYRTGEDGSILKGEHGLFAELPDGVDCPAFALCADATVVERMSGASMTPVLCDCLSFGRALRQSFGARYMAAVLPQRMKANQLSLLPVVEMFAKRQPGNEPLAVPATETKEARLANSVLAWLINDLRGNAGPMLQKQGGAYKGNPAYM
jgi:hypothetical protein